MTASQLNLKFGRQARDRGIKKAADHAGAEWNEKAYRLFQWWIQEQRSAFTIEQFRAFAAQKLEAPPSLRAFGGIARRASIAGLIVKDGTTQVTNVKAHCANANLWRKA